MISVSGGMTLGTFLGAHFSGSYEKLPGRGARAKGISLGLILWLILSVFLGLLNIGTLGYIIIFQVPLEGWLQQLCMDIFWARSISILAEKTVAPTSAVVLKNMELCRPGLLWITLLCL